MGSDLEQIKRFQTWLLGFTGTMAAVGIGALVMVGQYKERVDTMQTQLREVRTNSREMRSTITKMQLELATSMPFRPQPDWLRAPRPTLDDDESNN